MKSKITSAALLLALLCFTLSGCFSFLSDSKSPTEAAQPTTFDVFDTLPATLPAETTTFAMPETVTDIPTTEVPTTAEPITIIIPVTTEPPTQPPTTAAPETEVPTTEAPPTAPDYSSYSKSDVIKLYADALAKTRSCTDSITVHHKESFTGDVVQATPGGELTKQLANYIVGAIAKPTETDYSFSGGTATNEDGETIPLLLPQRTSFSLPEEGVQSATVTDSNGTLNVHIALVSEAVGFGEIPQYNSSAIGYLDTSKFSFKVITVNSCTITYTGSTIDAVIRPDGYISECTYSINLSTTGSVTGLGITGGGTIAGAQTEVWKINW